MYLTVAAADAYFQTYYGEDSFWFDLGDDEKAVYLANATLWIDSRYGVDFLGEILDDTQDNLFPRTEFVDNNGRRVPSGSIPKCLQNATAEAALLVYEGTDISGSEERGGIQSESVSVGSVSTSTSYTGAGTYTDESGKVSIMLEPILGDSGVAGFQFHPVGRG